MCHSMLYREGTGKSTQPEWDHRYPRHTLHTREVTDLIRYGTRIDRLSTRPGNG